ncbi:MAG: hypothetical protein HRU07_05755 [Nitrosopumilus sp.]|nr:hypothetical protein [Nitrosopumilus sp.]NRA05651.1 hypothetical protein [Nitrosopumilus sp.]
MLSMNNTTPLEKVHIHKVNVVVKIKKQIVLYEEIAKTAPKTLPVIQLGRISDKLFVLSNFDVYYGVKQYGLKSIECEIFDFKNDVEFIIEHVKLNKNPIGFNPLLLYGVLDYLESQKIPKSQALGLLQIHKTTNNKLLDLELHPKVIESLCSLHNHLAEKLLNFTIPYYIAELISKCKPIEQINAAGRITTLIKSSNITELKFAWPSVEEIEILLSNPIFREESKNSVIVEVTNVVSPPKNKEND